MIKGALVVCPRKHDFGGGGAHLGTGDGEV